MSFITCIASSKLESKSIPVAANTRAKYASPERIYLLNCLTWLVACQIPFELHCTIARKRGFLAVLHRARLDQLKLRLCQANFFFLLLLHSRHQFLSSSYTCSISKHSSLYAVTIAMSGQQQHFYPRMSPAISISSFTPPSPITDSRHRSSSRRRRRARSVREAIATDDTLPMLT